MKNKSLKDVNCLLYLRFSYRGICYQEQFHFRTDKKISTRFSPPNNNNNMCLHTQFLLFLLYVSCFWNTQKYIEFASNGRTENIDETRNFSNIFIFSEWFSLQNKQKRNKQKQWKIAINYYNVIMYLSLV